MSNDLKPFCTKFILWHWQWRRGADGSFRTNSHAARYTCWRSFQLKVRQVEKPWSSRNFRFLEDDRCHISQVFNSLNWKSEISRGENWKTLDFGRWSVVLLTLLAIMDVWFFFVSEGGSFVAKRTLPYSRSQSKYEGWSYVIHGNVGAPPPKKFTVWSLPVNSLDYTNLRRDKIHSFASVSGQTEIMRPQC